MVKCGAEFLAASEMRLQVRVQLRNFGTHALVRCMQILIAHRGTSTAAVEEVFERTLPTADRAQPLLNALKAP
jgi:hypothetical protein